MSETQLTQEVTNADKIECKIDGAMVHSIQAHIKSSYPDEWTVARYQEEYPNQPLLSPYAMMILERKRQEGVARQAQSSAPVAPVAPAVVGDAMLQANLVTGEPTNPLTVTKRAMHEVFELGNVPAAMSSGTGQPISVDVMTGHSGDTVFYLEETDRDYVFNIDLLKKVLVGIVLNKPVYLWGLHGTGKTTMFTQVFARTGRPVIRAQHTINMQESEVLGQWTVRNGQTEFQLGPLPMAMLYGMVYLADEYDMALPAVSALYQPVMEGQALLIKDAPPHLRRIVPHPDFRFVATGNTNGTGDETGLYQGTMIQNAANYSRFGVTEEVAYMEPAMEENVLRSKSKMLAPIAKKFVKIANEIRESFRSGHISMTISPRELINACDVGRAFGGDWKTGIQVAFGNRLPRADRELMKQYMQRHFE